METVTAPIHQRDAAPVAVEGSERLRHGGPELAGGLRRTDNGDPAGREKRR